MNNHSAEQGVDWKSVLAIINEYMASETTLSKIERKTLAHALTSVLKESVKAGTIDQARLHDLSSGSRINRLVYSYQSFREFCSQLGIQVRLRESPIEKSLVSLPPPDPQSLVLVALDKCVVCDSFPREFLAGLLFTYADKSAGLTEDCKRLSLRSGVHELVQGILSYNIHNIVSLTADEQTKKNNFSFSKVAQTSVIAVLAAAVSRSLEQMWGGKEVQIGNLLTLCTKITLEFDKLANDFTKIHSTASGSALFFLESILQEGPNLNDETITHFTGLFTFTFLPPTPSNRADQSRESYKLRVHLASRIPKADWRNLAIEYYRAVSELGGWDAFKVVANLLATSHAQAHLKTDQLAYCLLDPQDFWKRAYNSVVDLSDPLENSAPETRFIAALANAVLLSDRVNSSAIFERAVRNLRYFYKLFGVIYDYVYPVFRPDSALTEERIKLSITDNIDTVAKIITDETEEESKITVTLLITYIDALAVLPKSELFTLSNQDFPSYKKFVAALMASVNSSENPSSMARDIDLASRQLLKKDVNATIFAFAYARAVSDDLKETRMMLEFDRLYDDVMQIRSMLASKDKIVGKEFEQFKRALTVSKTWTEIVTLSREAIEREKERIERAKILGKYAKTLESKKLLIHMLRIAFQQLTLDSELAFELIAQKLPYKLFLMTWNPYPAEGKERRLSDDVDEWLLRNKSIYMPIGTRYTGSVTPALRIGTIPPEFTFKEFCGKVATEIIEPARRSGRAPGIIVMQLIPTKKVFQPIADLGDIEDKVPLHESLRKVALTIAPTHIKRLLNQSTLKHMDASATVETICALKSNREVFTQVGIRVKEIGSKILTDDKKLREAMFEVYTDAEKIKVFNKKVDPNLSLITSFFKRIWKKQQKSGSAANTLFDVITDDFTEEQIEIAAVQQFRDRAPNLNDETRKTIVTVTMQLVHVIKGSLNLLTSKEIERVIHELGKVER